MPWLLGRILFLLGFNLSFIFSWLWSHSILWSVDCNFFEFSHPGFSSWVLWSDPSFSFDYFMVFNSFELLWEFLSIQKCFSYKPKIVKCFYFSYLKIKGTTKSSKMQISDDIYITSIHKITFAFILWSIIAQCKVLHINAAFFFNKGKRHIEASFTCLRKTYVKWISRTC